MRLEWDKTGERLYESGVEKGVLYVANNAGWYGKGVVWNGLTAVNDSPSGGEANPMYADNIKYLNLMSAEESAGTIEAYTYPDEFMECDGSVEPVPGVVVHQQGRKEFAFSYVSGLGNDVDELQYGYKIHLVYAAKASPSEKAYNTVNDTPEANTFSWEYTTTALRIAGYKPTAHIEINSTKVASDKLAALEDILYGTSSSDARMPTIPEVIELIGAAAAKYAVSAYLTNVESDNAATLVSGSYTANLTAKTGYTIENVIVMMGGEDISDTAYSAGTVSISEVTGAITIFATANAN